MSSEVVRELFRNLENTLHDRLKVIEDILTTTKQSVSNGSNVNPAAFEEGLLRLQRHIESLEEYAMGEVRTLAFNHDMLEKRVDSLESSIRSAAESLLTINQTIGMMQKRIDDEKPVEAAEVEVEIEETQEAALNADIDPVGTETKARAALTKAVEELQEDVEEEEVEEEEVEEEEVEEEEVEEEEVEEEEVEEEVEETEELELEEFDYKKKTYYRDQHSNVYIADEDGCVDPSAVVGIWNPQTKKIDRVPAA
jgi:hypothetical protein